MERKIKINTRLNIDYPDLMLEVDTDIPFTLRDVIKAAVSSTKIPVDIMGKILRCRYLKQYWNEIVSHKFQNKGDMDYLQLYYSIDKYKGEQDTISYAGGWCFHGVGKLGVISEDVKKHCGNEPFPADYREMYAIEFSPLYELSGYKINICDVMTIDDIDEALKSKNNLQPTKCSCRPPITLLEVLYAIVWELSFFGSPKERVVVYDDLVNTKKEFDKAKKNGTLSIEDEED